MDILEELKEIQRRRFNLAMIDRWDRECFEADDRLWKRELELKKVLQERGESIEHL